MEKNSAHIVSIAIILFQTDFGPAAGLCKAGKSKASKHIPA
jgi:hypothetical protein